MKIKVYIHADYDEYEKVFRFKAWSHDMTGSEYCGPLVMQTEVEFTPPPHEVLINGTVETYRAMQKKVLAEAERERTVIQQRIDDLLCIEYKPETVE